MDIDENFKNNIVNLKHEIYENTVLSPELNTNEAQSIDPLEKYLENINNVYILSVNAQNGKINNNLDKFPKETRELISNLLIWIADYFKKNQVADTIPYKLFIIKKNLGTVAYQEALAEQSKNCERTQLAKLEYQQKLDEEKAVIEKEKVLRDERAKKRAKGACHWLVHSTEQCWASPRGA